MAATPEGRRHFQEELKELEHSATGAIDIVLEQLDRVLEALEHQDVELAQFVILDDDRLDGRYLEVHQGILSLLALQAPSRAICASSRRCFTSSSTSSAWATSA
jgi:phosphate transport system protein